MESASHGGFRDTTSTPRVTLDALISELAVFDALMDLVRGTGLSALIATHNLELAARMDRTVHLVDGRLT